MPTVLCYGDSNTWGYATEPRPGNRYGYDERWPGVMATALGARWHVIEEGLSGRTTVHSDPVEGEWLNGHDYLLPCLRSHQPLDVLVVMLGTNDLKGRFAVSPFDIAAGVGRLLATAVAAGVGPDGRQPRCLVVCPPPILPQQTGFPVWFDIFACGVEKSRQLPLHYALVAAESGAAFLDAGQIIQSSTFDGIHLDVAEHRKLGLAIAAKVADLA